MAQTYDLRKCHPYSTCGLKIASIRRMYLPKTEGVIFVNINQGLVLTYVVIS